MMALPVMVINATDFQLRAVCNRVELSAQVSAQTISVITALALTAKEHRTQTLFVWAAAAP